MTPPLLPHFVSVNGRLIRPDDAHVSIFNPVIHGAFGVYESIQLAKGVIFHLDDHLQRLTQSAGLINLPLPTELPHVTRWVQEMVDAHQQTLPLGQVETATIRLFLIGPADAQSDAQLFTWLQPLSRPHPADYAQGLGAVTYWGERALPQAKSLNTLVNTLARQKATAAGENEGLLVDRQGNLCEGASSNLFVVQQEGLWLPPDEQILAGVTSGLVLRFAQEAAIPVVRQPIPLTSLPDWAEAFLTSTSRHILPLVRVDGRPVGNGQPGPITQELSRRFEAYFDDYTGGPG